MPFICSALVAVPTAALARTPHGSNGINGGAGLGGNSPAANTPSSPAPATPTTRPAGTAAQVVHLSGVVNASGDGITLTASASGTQNHPLTISGESPASDAGATIDIEVAKPGATTWSQVATATIGSGGLFKAHWTPTASAQLELRAVLASGVASSSGGGSGGSGLGSASTAAGAIETAPITIPIFRNAVATLYGPGFWGHHTACGERLTRSTLGVASRTLKCGTRVAVFYRGREITVPVIDRGPFANGASWDLTTATAKALGVKETVTIGTLAPAPALATVARG